MVSALGAALCSDALHKSFQRGIGSPIVKHIIGAVTATVPLLRSLTDMEFISRHLGPDSTEQATMLAKVGYDLSLIHI